MLIEAVTVLVGMGLGWGGSALATWVRRGGKEEEETPEEDLPSDPYRTPALIEAQDQALPKLRVYCVDCRFRGIGGGSPICLAQPRNTGKYPICGQKKTNQHFDCTHFQKKET